MRFLPTPRDRQILDAVRTHNRLTSEQVGRLFFRRGPGQVATVQAVNTRMRKLVAGGYLDVAVVNGGRGSGPYAYGLGPRGRDMLQRLTSGRHRGGPGPVWHDLEVAGFRVRLQEELESHGGQLTEWVGEPAARALLHGQHGWPVPDAVVHWRLRTHEGSFLLEWDRGSESLAILIAKLAKYGAYWRTRGHHRLLPGLGLRPRLGLVVHDEQRKVRVVRWLTERPSLLQSTVAVGTAAEVTASPLRRCWWRSDSHTSGSLFE